MLLLKPYVGLGGVSLVQRSSTECGVSECDREAAIMRRPWFTRDFFPTEENIWY
jgi:hypothetical protein